MGNVIPFATHPVVLKKQRRRDAFEERAAHNRRYCLNKTVYPLCACAHKCDYCNDHLSPEERKFALQFRTDVACQYCRIEHSQ